MTAMSIEEFFSGIVARLETHRLPGIIVIVDEEDGTTVYDNGTTKEECLKLLREAVDTVRRSDRREGFIDVKRRGCKPRGRVTD